MLYNTKEIIDKTIGGTNIIGERLYTLRKETNTKVSHLAEYLADNHHKDDIGVEGIRALYYKWENGEEKPNLEMLLNICNFYDCEIDYILGGISEKTRCNTDIKQKTGLSIFSINKIISHNDHIPDNEELDLIISSDCYGNIINYLHNLRTNFKRMHELARFMHIIKNEEIPSLYDTSAICELTKAYDEYMDEFGKREYKMDMLMYQCFVSFSNLLNEYKETSLKEINVFTSQLKQK